MTSNGEAVRAAVLNAEERIRSRILETPLEYSHHLSHLGKCQVYLKLENQQRSKSFKFRGALNKVLTLPDEMRKRGIITASTGNHGVATAQVLEILNLEGMIFLPENSSAAKVDNLRMMNARLEFYGSDCVEAEKQARRLAEERGLPFISPYNDLEIIAGQGTIAVELERQLDHFDAVLSPVGGGGLMGGIAGYLKQASPNTEQIGCQPLTSAVMYESVKAGRLVDLESRPTLSDGTAGGIEPASITFDICQEYVDDFILVTEDEIRRALRLLIAGHSMLVEGAGALSTACFLKDPRRFAGKTIVLIVSGARIGLETLREVLGEARLGYQSNQASI